MFFTPHSDMSTYFADSNVSTDLRTHTPDISHERVNKKENENNTSRYLFGKKLLLEAFLRRGREGEFG
jgi:hypothetical protein